jgi:hypothetical protein
VANFSIVEYNDYIAYGKAGAKVHKNGFTNVPKAGHLARKS